jgi:ATP-dependent DNA helicase DinG
MPDTAVLVTDARGALLVTADGEVEELSFREAAKRAVSERLIVCHAAALARRLECPPFPSFDLLELFAFTLPAEWCVPTPRGLARRLSLPEPKDKVGEAMTLLAAAELLLGLLMRRQDPVGGDAAGIAHLMGRGGWSWAPAVLAALGEPVGVAESRATRAISIWRHLPEWSEEAPPPPPGTQPVSSAEARERLHQLLMAGHEAEERPQQADYSSAAAAAFAPRERADVPVMVLAEAGTGVGKTLGYLAPATLWAEKNGGAVWVSTYTRNLQHQIDGELNRLYPGAEEKSAKVVIRKGRENYLCLLNLEEAARALPTRLQDARGIGLMARWASATRDGDLSGSDFPGWLADLVGVSRSHALADRRGECIFSACQHYNRCFIERSIRQARHARVVVANHALVMVQAAMGGLEERDLPSRYVFDEGHHLFEAADSAFAGHLTGLETAELRRWLLGAEGGRSRARGLKRRVEDLMGEDRTLPERLDEIMAFARVLPGEGWQQRLGQQNPVGEMEQFLAVVRELVYARASAKDSPYSLEIPTDPVTEELMERAGRLDEALARVLTPLAEFTRRLGNRLVDEAETLETGIRQRIEAVVRSLERRAVVPLRGWRQMLDALGHTTPPVLVDWLGVERNGGSDLDIGLYRHWVDPTQPFMEAMSAHAHGLLVTSATLTDGTGDVEDDWQAAEARTGASHLPVPALRAAVPSPYDYPARTRVFVVGDVRKDDLDQVAGAYRALFEASGGGGLGLFTAISRLRAVHQRIAQPLEQAGLPLLAQHVDGLDIGTLIDIFRAEENACLLGTDAVRDGVDVPGRSLRLICFDRVPWPRPDILHKARREAFGKKRYDDMITRLRLKQAFGRLVRRQDDQGVFVLLDPMMPSRLAGAFPPGVEVQRVGLAEAVAQTREFLHSPSVDIF